MKKLITLNDALKTVFSNVPKLDSEVISVFDSLGHVLSNDVVSKSEFPILSTAAVDGFAIKLTEKKEFEITDTTYTGDEKSTITNGTVRVSTGAFVPDWADVVIMKEDVVEKKGKITFKKDLRKGLNINGQGSIFSKNEIVAKHGAVIDSGIMGLICSVNQGRVSVFKRPQVAVIATGGEISEPGDENLAGIPNSSAHMIISSAIDCGAAVTYLGIVKDEKEDLKSELKDAIQNFDIVLTTGGVSVGDVDLLPKIMKDVGVNVLFWKVLQKPGKPVLFGKTKRGIYLGIPGYPTSAATVAEVYLKGLLRKMQNIDPIFKVTATVSKAYSRTPRQRTELARCRLFFDGGNLFADILQDQMSANPKSFANANGFAILEPVLSELKAGEKITVIPKWGLKKATIFDIRNQALKKNEDLF